MLFLPLRKYKYDYLHVRQLLSGQQKKLNFNIFGIVVAVRNVARNVSNGKKTLKWLHNLPPFFIFATVKDLYPHYYFITICYTTVFLISGLLLLLGRVPLIKELHNYRRGRRFFSMAYLLLGFFGVLELLFWNPKIQQLGGYTYADVFPMAAVSMLHAWLNGYGYLLMLNPSRETRHKVFRMGIRGLPLVFAAGALVLWLAPEVNQYGIWALNGVYILEISWMFWLCRREYLINVKALHNYYDEPERLGWMNGIIYLTLILAFFNMIQYSVPVIGVGLRALNTVCYVYFAMRVMDYIPAFMSIGKATPPTTEEMEAPSPERLPFYPETMPEIVAKWVAKERFCETNLNITDVARQMNTNRNYLSAYLNHALGITFSQWLNVLRVEHAKTLFEAHPDKNVSEIGMMVGIPEVYNFSRRFKRVTDISPQKWIETTADEANGSGKG